jgi:hypothetical protein
VERNYSTNNQDYFFAMIDWVAFVDALDDENFEELSKSVQLRNIDVAEEKARNLVLSFSEVELAREHPARAVGKIQSRLNCDFLVAKFAVDEVLMNDSDEAIESAIAIEEKMLEAGESTIEYEKILTD